MEEILNYWSELSLLAMVATAVFAAVAGIMLLFFYRRVIFEFIYFILNSFIKIIIASAILMAVVILVITFVNFSNNQVAFTEGSNMVFNEIKRLTDMISAGGTSADVTIAKDAISTDIQYMERLSVMHKQSLSYDLYAFIYIFLCSILLGVGAYLLNKGERYAQKSKKIYSILYENYSELDKKFYNLDDNYLKLDDSHSKLAKEQTELANNSGVLATNQTKMNDKFLELSEMCSKLENYIKNLEKDSARLKERADHNDKLIRANENSILLTSITQRFSEVQKLIQSYRDKPENRELTHFTARLGKVARHDMDDINFSETERSVVDLFKKQLEAVKVLYKTAAERDEKEWIHGGINEVHKKTIEDYFRIIESKLRTAASED